MFILSPSSKPVRDIFQYLDIISHRPGAFGARPPAAAGHGIPGTQAGEAPGRVTFAPCGTPTYNPRGICSSPGSDF